MGLHRGADRRGRQAPPRPLTSPPPIVRHALPGGLSVLAIAAALHLPVLQPWVLPLLPSAPYMVFLAGALFGWRLGQAWLALAFPLLGLATAALLLPLDARTASVVRDAVALALPVNLAVIAALATRGLRRRGVATAFFVMAAQALAIAIVAQPEAQPVADALAASLLDVVPSRVGALAQPALVVFALALAMPVIRLVREPLAAHGAAAWAIVASAIALAETGPESRAVAWLGAAGVALVVGLVEASRGLAYEDALTGLPARRALESDLRRLGGRYAIAMVDIDHFKRVNDDHGHVVGDQVLRMVAGTLARALAGGTAYRYGGEEFALVFPGRGVDEVLPDLETVRHAVETAPFLVRGRDRPRRKPDRPRAGSGSSRLPVTVSIGVADGERRRGSPDDVLRAADAALYRAKRGGRNQVAV